MKQQIKNRIIIIAISVIAGIAIGSGSTLLFTSESNQGLSGAECEAILQAFNEKHNTNYQIYWDFDFVLECHAMSADEFEAYLEEMHQGTLTETLPKYVTYEPETKGNLRAGEKAYR